MLSEAENALGAPFGLRKTMEATEVKGTIYTVNGAIVMKDVYLNDVKDRLKEGIYFFNNKKIYINKRK